ncbi:MAG: nucleotide exchange factor GrpE [Ruminococcus sp.]|jgi:molecular chaperone GrpE|nr:nucleotide exchange factor GrpE [Ruminococcus sp.]
MENEEILDELQEEAAEDAFTEEIAEEITEQITEQENGEIEMLKKKVSEEHDNYLRALAEYDNFRKRSVKDRLTAVAQARTSDITEFLSVTDNIQRALATECSDANFKKGVEMIAHQFDNILEKIGVKEIEAQGKPFDPNFHNAINFREDENFGDNTVCEVVQKGYMLGDKVVRFAMVIVANP